MGVLNLWAAGRFNQIWKAVDDAAISANFHAAHLLVDGAASRTEHHELPFAVDQVVV